MNLSPFPCYKCGACCRQVGKVNIINHNLDRGDGVCRYLNEKTNLCEIYDKRPDICRVDVMYNKYYKDKISWKEFCDFNLHTCDKLNNKIEGI